MDTFESLAMTVPVEETKELCTLDSDRLKLAEMISLGKPTAYIVAALDKTPNWVRQHRKDPDVSAFVQVLQSEAVEQAKSVLVSGTAKAADTIIEIMTDGPPSIRLSAAQDLLNRIGMRAPDKKEISQTVTYQVPREERLSAIRARMERLGLKMDGGEGEGEIIYVD